MLAFPGFKETPKTWDTYSANVLTNSIQMEQSQSEPESNVEHFLAQAKDKLNMQDAVRSYKTGDEGRLLAMNLRKLENGCALQYKPLLIHEIATALELENTNTSLIPESISQKPQDEDD